MILEDLSPMPFGKHKGDDMEDVPAQYLMWLWNQNEEDYNLERHMSTNKKAVMDYIKDNMDALILELIK